MPKLLITAVGGPLALLALAGASCLAHDERPAGTAEQQAALGVKAAEQFPGLGGLCDLTMAMRDVNAPRPEGAGRPGRGEGRPRGDRPGRGDGEQVAAPAMRVFDNLYFVGNAGVSAWVVGDESGYILIDALTSNDAAKSEIDGGMRALGLDPAKIKYLLITHAHGDHFGGYRYIVDTYKPTVVMSEPDWQLAATLQPHPRFGSPPPRGMSVKDGDTLTAGRTKITIHVTPGHTLGTISPIFTVTDKGAPHTAALWGGTGFNFGRNEKQLQIYADSALAYKALAEREGVDVFLSNHPSRDGSLDKMQKLAARKPGAPNPFVLGKQSLVAFDVLSHCASAQAARLRAEDASQER